ncbi:MAG: hypothetical protein ACRDYX_16365 [Egibacteraceae bacterium]
MGTRRARRADRYHATGLQALTDAVTQALDLDEETTTRMRQAADTRARAERDLAVRLPSAPAFFWAVRW